MSRVKVKRRRKILSFDTCVRNPERYLNILKEISEFEGKVLDNSNLLSIVVKLYQAEIVTSKKIDKNKISDLSYMKNKVVEVCSSKKAIGGFPKGYQSRFWHYMWTMSEFGIVYTQYKEVFRISDIGHKWLSGEISDMEMFSTQSMKYNRKSPYKRCSNDFNYFRFIIKLIEKLSRKLSYNEFCLSLHVERDDVDAFIKCLEKHKSKFLNREATWDYIRNRYSLKNSDNTKKTNMTEYPDQVLRLLRISGFVSIYNRGQVYIDINRTRKDLIDRLINYDFTLNDAEKEIEYKYFTRVGSTNQDLLDIVVSDREFSIPIVEYKTKLAQFIDENNSTQEIIVNELTNLVKNKSGIDTFKYFASYVRLEFLSALLLYMNYSDDYVVKPNYKMDDSGAPLGHAGGGKADIEVYKEDKTVFWTVEVTLIRNKDQQKNNETTTVVRHLKNKVNEEGYENAYLSLVAPLIHEDVRKFLEFSIVDEKRNGYLPLIKPQSIEEFISDTVDKKNIEEISGYSYRVIDNFKKSIASL